MAQLTESQSVRRALDRLGFGAPEPELAAAQRRGWSAIAGLVGRGGDDAGATRTPMPTLEPVPKPGKPPSAADRKQRQLAQRHNKVAATRWWLERMVAADHQLTERLTWFWHGHFATSVAKVRSAGLMLQQNETMRRGGDGPFTDLARAMIIDPAMLIWLDGNDNTSTSPNENLAREFMELFTLGHGHYTEDDVKQGARALTGWVVRRTDTGTGTARFVKRRHDDRDKTILGKAGDFDARSFVDLVVSRPESPAFVTGRVWARLVSHTPPDQQTMAHLVEAYGADRRIDRLLTAMIATPAFRDSASGLVKEPVIWLVGLLRALQVDPARLDDKHANRLIAALRGMGQAPFLPPSVGGWPAGQGWLSTATMATRLGVARQVAMASPVTKHLTGSGTAQVDAVGKALGVDGWSERTTNALAQVAGQPAQLVALAACSPEYIVSR